ncbi:MAG: DUF3987 domain-containing protein [Magnetococcales bacterium]|nr:DUF3987 domain-containing protein [Magnetococcales bacterium]
MAHDHEGWPDPQPITINSEEPEPYPFEALPDAILRAAAEMARFAKVPVVSPAVIGLSVIATAIGKKARIEERPGLYLHPALFLALIAGSGERKSPPFKIMTGPLEDWAKELAEIFSKNRQETLAQHRVIDKLIATLEREAAKKDWSDSHRDELVERIAAETRKKRPVPPPPRLFTTDATEERLFQKLHDHGGAYAVLSGEGRSVLDSIMGKYSGKDRTGDAIYLAGISGDTITRDRVGGENGPEERVIYNPCLNVCVMTQPDKFLELASHSTLRDSGALARIWPVHLQSLVGTRMESANEAGLDDLALETYREIVTQLLKVKMPEKDGKPISHLVRLSPEAAEERRKYHNKIEQMMGAGSRLDDVRDIASKAVSATCKAALVIHLMQNPHFISALESELSPETWRQAQQLGAYHLSEAVRIQRTVGEDGETQKIITIGKWLKEKRITELKASYLYQMGPRPRLTAKEAETMLETLEGLRWVYAAPLVKSQRKVLYLVNPKLANLAILAGE